MVPDRYSKWKKTTILLPWKAASSQRRQRIILPGGKHTAHNPKEKALPVANRPCSTGTRSLAETVTLWLQEGRARVPQAGGRPLAAIQSHRRSFVCLSPQLKEKILKEQKKPQTTHQHNYKDQLSRKQATIYRLQLPAKTNPLTV